MNIRFRPPYWNSSREVLFIMYRDGEKMINKLINELINYGVKNQMIETDDKVYVTNRLLELFELMEYTEESIDNERPLCEILDEMMAYAFEKGIMKEDTIT